MRIYVTDEGKLHADNDEMFVLTIEPLNERFTSCDDIRYEGNVLEACYRSTRGTTAIRTNSDKLLIRTNETYFLTFSYGKYVQFLYKHKQPKLYVALSTWLDTGKTVLPFTFMDVYIDSTLHTLKIHLPKGWVTYMVSDGVTYQLVDHSKY